MTKLVLNNILMKSKKSNVSWFNICNDRKKYSVIVRLNLVENFINTNTK